MDGEQHTGSCFQSFFPRLTVITVTSALAWGNPADTQEHGIYPSVQETMLSTLTAKLILTSPPLGPAVVTPLTLPASDGATAPALRILRPGHVNSLIPVSALGTADQNEE